jgi:tRNA nucleotidyltransferase (CCA-adding enzyme)
MLKEAIKEAILEGEILNDYDAAYGFMMSRKNRIN